MTSNARSNALVLLLGKVTLGVTLATGFALQPHAVAQTVTSAIADDGVDPPAIVRDSTGELRDCTVTWSNGDRADFDPSCDPYWSIPA